MRMRLRIIIALVAVAAVALTARGCSGRKDGAATKVEIADDAVAGDKSQSAEFSLSAEDDEGFDLPEREEIRQKRNLTPGTKVFVRYDMGRVSDRSYQQRAWRRSSGL